jgi:hypothetical protein
LNRLYHVKIIIQYRKIPLVGPRSSESARACSRLFA